MCVSGGSADWLGSRGPVDDISDWLQLVSRCSHLDRLHLRRQLEVSSYSATTVAIYYC